VSNASTVTFSQLRAAPSGSDDDCVTLAEFLFPDRLDEERFQLLVTNKLYARLEELTATIHAAVADTVTNFAPIRNVFVTTAAAASVALNVVNTPIRIPGAPRGSWAGLDRALVNAEFDSSDGPLLIALKQARGVFDDRMRILFDDANVCAGKPVSDSVAANAYVLPGGDCSFLLLGLLRKPLADERYDNASLASRIGFVIGHELAHNEMTSSTDETMLAALLLHYPSNVFDEAIADVISAVSIVRAGLASAEALCSHQSQIWCARVPAGWVAAADASHPAPNARGNALCDTLIDLGFFV